MIYGTIRKSAFHFVLIVRAFKDAQWFFGPLGAEEFADNDEKAECRCHSDCTSGEQAKKLPDEFRNMEPDVPWCGVSVTCAIGLRMITMSLIATGCIMP